MSILAYNDIPEYQGDGLDTEHCGDIDCIFHDNGGFCVFETCIFKEIPEIHSSWTCKCVICGTPFDFPSTHVRVPVCEECWLHWKDTILNDREFTCGFCGAKQDGNRHVPDADICDTCWAKLKSIIENCPM